MVKSNINTPFITLDPKLLSLDADDLKLLLILKASAETDYCSSDDRLNSILFKFGYSIDTFIDKLVEFEDKKFLKFDPETKEIRVLV